MQIYPHKEFILRKTGETYKVLNGKVLKLVGNVYVNQRKYNFQDILNNEIFKEA